MHPLIRQARWWPRKLWQWTRDLRYTPGTLICDCRYRHLRITARNGDDVELEDGFHCSVQHCVNPAPHDWEHPEGYQ